VKCDLCNEQKNFKTISTQIREGEGLILECNNCKHIFQALEMNSDELEEYYNDIYTATNSLSIDKIEVEEHFQERKKTLDNMLEHIKPILKKDMKVLDIGSGAGALLYSIKDYVQSMYATELNKSYVQFMNKKGINAQYGFFEKLNFDTKFDLIISINALDHMPYPMEILYKIYDSLEENGTIYFELPNRNEALNFFLPPENQKNFNTFFWHKAHFHYFYENTIQYALEKVGFKDINIDSRHQYTINNFLHWYYKGERQNIYVDATTNTDLYSGNNLFELKMNELFKNINQDFLKIMKETKRGDSLVITAKK
jgi:2-polyprenyl-3-methyl-5-hydroxy-6-metoxy-1,4-benzoquinol methylase